MGSIVAASKAQKNAIGGAGVGGIGTVQQSGITTAGAAFNLTAWAGREVIVHVSAACFMRWAAVSSSTAIDTTTTGASAAAPVATGGGKLYADMPNYRDVPRCDAPANGEGVFLVIDLPSGTVDVWIECSG